MSIVMVPFSKLPEPAKIEQAPSGVYVTLTDECEEFCQRYAKLQSEFSNTVYENVLVGKTIEFGYCVTFRAFAAQYPQLELKLLHNPFRSSYGELGDLHRKDDIQISFGTCKRYIQIEDKGGRCGQIANIHNANFRFLYDEMSVYRVYGFGLVQFGYSPVFDIPDNPREPRWVKERRIYLAGIGTPASLLKHSVFLRQGTKLSDRNDAVLKSSKYSIRQKQLFPLNIDTLLNIRYCRID